MTYMDVGKQEVIQFMVDGISNGPSSSRTIPDLVGKGQSRRTVLLVLARVSRISGSHWLQGGVSKQF